MFQCCLCKMMLTVLDLTVCSLLFWREMFEEVFHAKQSYSKNLVYMQLCTLSVHYGMTVTAFKSPNLTLPS